MCNNRILGYAFSKTFELLCLALCFVYFASVFKKSILEKYDIKLNFSSDTDNGKIVIGLITCRGLNGASTESLERTTTLIKSIMISAQLYQQTSVVEFHHFLENPQDEMVIRQKLKDMGYDYDYDKVSNNDTSSKNKEDGTTKRVELKMNVYSIKDVNIPNKYVDKAIYHSKLRCAYAPFYFPSALPKVDRIIYMDNYGVVTGNVMDLWNQFVKMQRSDKMVGVVKDIAESKNEGKLKNIPDMRKNGIDPGFLWMNLNRMREFNWEARISKVHKDYAEIIKPIAARGVLTTLVYNIPNLVTILPCQYNFMSTACKSGLVCKDAQEDPMGIQMVHLSDSDYLPENPLYGIYKHYRDFRFQGNNNSSIDSIKTDLLMPIRNWYNSSSTCPKCGECKGTLSQLLFPKVF